MSLLVKSVQKRVASLLARKENGVLSIINGRPVAVAPFHKSPSDKSHPASASKKLDDNIVLSPHSDCHLHGMNLVHRFFDNASRWPGKIALVNKLMILIEISSIKLGYNALRR